MRIVAGLYKSRHIAVPPGRDIRPTSDKVRGAIFNVLQSMGGVDGLNVLDAFCGSGALGLEALSRGAALACFADKAASSLDCARANAASLGVGDGAALFLKQDSAKPPRPPTDISGFDLVFLDPPYRLGLVAAALQALQAQGWIAPAAIIVAETEREHSPAWPDFVRLLQTKIYGETAIHFLESTENRPQ